MTEVTFFHRLINVGSVKLQQSRKPNYRFEGRPGDLVVVLLWGDGFTVEWAVAVGMLGWTLCAPNTWSPGGGSGMTDPREIGACVIQLWAP